MPRVRFTVRTLMLGVALSAVVISLAVRREAVRRASHYRILADRYADRELIAQELIREIEVALRTRPDYPCSELDLRSVREHQEYAAYYAALTAKFEQAARHPLSPVAPDPPPPVRVPGLSQPEGMKLVNRKVDPSEVMKLIKRRVDPSKRGDGDERAE
jgi:hypothetical protein